MFRMLGPSCGHVQGSLTSYVFLTKGDSVPESGPCELTSSRTPRDSDPGASEAGQVTSKSEVGDGGMSTRE